MTGTWLLRRGEKARGFRYETEAGRVVRDRRVLKRIAALGVPPGWHDVHVAADPSAAVQAWGIDDRGRKQYRYHARAVEQGNLRKHYRVRDLARELPAIRARLARDAARHDGSRAEVCAMAVRLLHEGFFRVGSDRYARENRTFGLTTLRKSHVTVWGDDVTFEFRGKHGVRQWKVISGAALARFMKRMQAHPGTRLFRYREGRRYEDLTADDVNDYVGRITGGRFTAKDFRTWGGTLRFATVLADLGAPESLAQRKKNVVLGVRLVAAELGNTPAICRQSYVHPIVIARYLDAGETIHTTPTRARARRAGAAGYAPEERALIRFLDRNFPERRRRRRVEERAA